MLPTVRCGLSRVFPLLAAALLPGFAPAANAQIIGGTPLITPLGWKIWKGTNDPQPSATDWRLPGYDDSGWISGRST